MSDRERISILLDSVPDCKIGYLLAYIQGLTADEEADERFCEELYQRYLDDPDPEKEAGYPLEECKKEWGLA